VSFEAPEEDVQVTELEDAGDAPSNRATELVDAPILEDGFADWEEEEPFIDILENNDEWTQYTNGQEIREALIRVSEQMLASTFLRDLEQFPFIDGVDVEMNKALLVVLREDWVTIGSFLERQISDVRAMITRVTALARWGYGVAAGLAVVLNQPEGTQAWTSALLDFLRPHVEAYAELVKTLGLPTSRILSDPVREILGIWEDVEEEKTGSGSARAEMHVDESVFPDQVVEETQLVTLDELVRPRHPTIGCEVCKLLSIKGRLLHLESISQIGRGLKKVVGKEENWNKDRRDWTTNHLLQLITFVAHNDGASDMALFCLESADDILTTAFTRLLDNPIFSLTPNQQAEFMQIARMCHDSLSAPLRQHMIPSLLYTVYPETLMAHQNVNVEVSQSPEGTIDLQEVMDTLSTLTKKDFLSNTVNVKFTGSDTIGNGGRLAFIEKAIKEAFNPDNGIFSFSDNREVYIKPASWAEIPNGRSRETQERYLRMAGRLLGMAIQDDQSPAVFLTKGTLAHLRRPVQNLPLENAEMLQIWLQREDPEFAENMNKLRIEVGYSEGSEFEDLNGQVHELNSTNAEEYIAAQARRKVIQSIDSQAYLIVRGVYDVLPYPQLSWLQVPELELMMEGSRVVDKADLKKSATMLHGLDVFEDVSQASEWDHVDEFVWFWEIYDNMTEIEVRDLLQFVSASRNAPIQGFTGSKGDRKWFQIQLDRSIDDDMVPKAQLCFTQLRIPHYSSKEIMKKRILFAIGNCSTVDAK
jgi:hypothetical protein